MKDIRKIPNPPILQSAMAGISDADFCQFQLNLGVSMVILGGYPIDKINSISAKELSMRGRKEFIPPIDAIELAKWLDKNISLKKPNETQITAANVRCNKIDAISKIWFQHLDENLDFIELNAHCRQEEVTKKGGGERLLQNLSKLDSLLDEITSILCRNNLGIKIRGYRVLDLKHFIEILESYDISYIHVDAMVENKPKADLEIIKKILSITTIPLIGNNSVRNIEDVKKMIGIGATGVSIARPLIEDKKFISKLIKQ